MHVCDVNNNYEWMHQGRAAKVGTIREQQLKTQLRTSAEEDTIG